MSDSLERLYLAVLAAKDLDPAISRTARLFQRGPAKMAKKLAEEAIEVVIDAVNGNSDAVVRESADLLYNLTVLWASAGVRPDDIPLASIYDDYPTMVLAQLNDLGMIPGSDLARFARRDIGERRFPLNTWGGMLSAGQPGGPAGGLNGISEAVLQLQHRADARQVKDARLAVASGYGMTMYRYGGTAAAAVLERMA